MKTASRILGSAFFLEGFEVQDAPRYGAERRGAPIFAYVRAGRGPIHERGVIHSPDLVIVADDSLVPVPAADVLAGIDERSVLLILTPDSAAVWKNRVNLQCRVVTLPSGADPGAEQRYPGASCAGAAARLVGVISRSSLEQAISNELGSHGAGVVERNLGQALDAFEQLAGEEGTVREGEPESAVEFCAPDWIELPFDTADVSAPAIHAGGTSVEVRTGLWRVLRPIIDYDRCRKCWWVCSTFCPDGAIEVDEGRPVIDYDHCKGCMICVAQCPPHAIEAVPEHGSTATTTIGAQI